MDAEERGERWHRRRTAIVDTAAELFAGKGYYATGVAELCRAVDLGRGSLYYYIGSKENLLNLIHDRVIKQVLESGEAVESLDATPIEKLRLLGVDLVRIITQYPDHVWVFLHEWHALTGERAQEFRAKRRSYERVVRKILEEGVEAGDFAIRDYDLAVLAWLSMHNYTYQWYRREGRLTPMQIANEFFRLYLDGVRAEAPVAPEYAHSDAAT